MSISKIIEEMAFNIGEELIKDTEYAKVNSAIIKLQKELRKELSEEGKTIFSELCDLEAQSEGISNNYCCNQAFLQGIALGQAVEANKINI